MLTVVELLSKCYKQTVEVFRAKRAFTLNLSLTLFLVVLLFVLIALVFFLVFVSSSLKHGGGVGRGLLFALAGFSLWLTLMAVRLGDWSRCLQDSVQKFNNYTISNTYSSKHCEQACIILHYFTFFNCITNCLMKHP